MIHLTTAVGGYVKVLPHMLQHYRALGVDSFFVHVNLLDDGDPILDEVRAVCEVTSRSRLPKKLAASSLDEKDRKSALPPSNE